MKAAHFKALTLVLAAGLPWAAGAQSYSLTGSVRAHASTVFPPPTRMDQKADNVSWANRPEALQDNALQVSASMANGGAATARFLGRVGALKAYAVAASPYGVDAGATTVFSGGANAEARGSFYDTVMVGGAGLALGTPVDYTINFSISGSLSPEIFLLGGPSADAVAQVEMYDLQGLGGKRLVWQAKNQETGVYALTVATQVGHTLGISGELQVLAAISTGTTAARSVVANFYNSAIYTLTPSVEGLNTVGVSGHNFLAPVPEPATWALLGLGLAALHLLRKRGATSAPEVHRAD